MERLYDAGHCTNRLTVILFDYNIIRFVRIFAPYEFQLKVFLLGKTRLLRGFILGLTRGIDGICLSPNPLVNPVGHLWRCGVGRQGVQFFHGIQKYPPLLIVGGAGATDGAQCLSQKTGVIIEIGFHTVNLYPLRLNAEMVLA